MRSAIGLIAVSCRELILLCYSLVRIFDSLPMDAGGAMTGNRSLRLVLAALGLWAGAAGAAPPKEVLVTREVQDFYRVASGAFYIKTIGCYENVFSDRANLRLNVSGKGGMLLFRNGHQCVVEKFLQEVEASKITIKPSLF
jgi:hypothetical protein